jgi:hypothetical protein
MALGRVFGPLVGGAIVTNGELIHLGIVSCATMVAASLLLLYVDRKRFIVTGQVE